MTFFYRFAISSCRHEISSYRFAISSCRHAISFSRFAIFSGRLVAFGVGMLAGCLAAQAAEPARTTLRVGVWSLWHDRELAVEPLGPASTIRLCATCAAAPLTEATVKAEPGGLGWRAGKLGKATEEIDLPEGARLRAHGETLALVYPVRLRCVQGALQIVATVPVERYVELAVAAESGAADSEESRKALAVVARSYALDRTVRHAGFDLCDSTHCQWVRWRVTPEAHQAALATAGASLWFKGVRMSAVFHQNCGGRTAAASEIWPASPAQQGMVSRADPYCQRTGSADWTAQLSLHDLTAALAAAGLAQPGWRTLRVAERTASGRTAAVVAGNARIPAEQFRLAVGRALGWNQIRSDWFEVAAAGDGFVFHGRGSGHGVGLCQAGAAEMAREGISFTEILARYFPAAQIADVATGHPWQRINAKGFFLETTEQADAQFVPALSQALAMAESRSGLHARAPLGLRTYRSTPAFRDATLAPGWVAAFTEGDRIALQPLRVLAARKLLASVAEHEFLHALVEEQATSATPLWLREGLVEAFAGEAARGVRPAMTLEQATSALAHARTEKESEAAHRAAGWYAAQLLKQYGRGQMQDWLRKGPPQPVVDALR
jgi:stage II sporulation protein D